MGGLDRDVLAASPRQGEGLIAGCGQDQSAALAGYRQCVRDGILPAAGHVDDHVHALSAGDLMDALAEVLFFDVDRVVRSQPTRDFKAVGIAREAGDDDTVGAGLLGGEGAA